jgi:anion-transporting  ArsA/GET3 family ATPase
MAGARVSLGGSDQAARGSARSPEAGRAVDRLFARSLLVVTGKGGVGKSTVAAAFGLAAQQRGLRTIVVEVASRDDLSRALGGSGSDATHTEGVVSDRLHHISIEPQSALEEYLRQRLPIGALAGVLARNRMFAALSAATPGMRELITIGKVWELAQPHRRTRGFDLVVLDAPASGHCLAMLQAPRTFASIARVGPVAKQGRAVANFLDDPQRTAVVAVSTAEEMPVAETLELRATLRTQLGLDLSLVVVNAVVPHSFSAADERTLRAAPPSPARHAALFSAGWARHQRTQAASLHRGLPDVPLITLPLVFESALDHSALEWLSREFDR